MSKWLMLLPALLLDGFSGMLMLAISGIAFTGSAAVAWIPFAGQAAATGISFSGMIIGAIISDTLTLTVGSGLLYFLAQNDLFYPWYAVPTYVGKLVPFINIIPGWTVMTAVSILRKSADEGSLLAGAALAVARPTSVATRAMSDIRPAQNI